MFIIKKTMNLIKLIVGLIIIVMILFYFNLNNEEEKTVSNNYEYSIINETEKCDNQKELLINMDNNNYYLPCTSSETIFVLFPDGTKFSIKEAIAEYRMNIEDLMNSGLEVIKIKE